MQPKRLLTLALLLPLFLFAQEQPFKRVIPLTPNPQVQYYHNPDLGLQETHSSSKVKVIAGQKISFRYSMEGSNRINTVQNIFKRVARAVGIGTILYQSNRMRNSKSEGQKFNPYIPPIAIGASVALPLKSKRIAKQNEGMISIDVFDGDGKFLGSKFIREKSKMHSYVVEQDGYVKISRMGMVDYNLNKLKLEAIVAGKESSFEGGIVESMQLESEGECLPAQWKKCKDPQYAFTCECNKGNPFYCGTGADPAPCDTLPLSCACNPSFCEPQPPGDGGGGTTPPEDHFIYEQTFYDNSNCKACTTTVRYYTSGRIVNVGPFCTPIPNCSIPVVSPDPCTQAARNSREAEEALYNNEIYPIVTPFPSTVATDPNQYSFTIQNKPAPNQPYSMANVTSGTPGSAPLVYNANTVAIGHTYPAGSFTAPSLADLYNLGTAYSANGLCTRDYIFTAGGEEFALVITDPVAFNAFLASYPAAANLDAGTNSFIVGTPMYNYFESVRSYLLYPQMLSPENAYKYALAMVFLKFNAGVTLMRKDSGNTYEMIFGWEITWPNGGTTYSQLVCK